MIAILPIVRVGVLGDELMEDTTLGRLASVDLRKVWSSESGHFTPWLAREENLAVLGETLDLELELEAQEKAVGPFRADILCRDKGSNALVLIENQLERTDHGHLGQLLTYASGLEAATIIWIAGRFNEEHRATLDWLNAITDERFRFFGLEVELWRIGKSRAAPKFNVVSKPNDWSRSVARGRRSIVEGELSGVRAMQLEYWTELNAVLAKAGGRVPGNRKPLAQSWLPCAIGRTDFSLNAVMRRPLRCVGVEVYISGSRAKAFFRELNEQHEVVEEELGYALQWEELPTRNDSRIWTPLEEVDVEDREDWPRQHEWLAKRLDQLHRVFSVRIRSLDGEASPGSGDE